MFDYQFSVWGRRYHMYKKEAVYVSVAFAAILLGIILLAFGGTLLHIVIAVTSFLVGAAALFYHEFLFSVRRRHLPW